MLVRAGYWTFYLAFGDGNGAIHRWSRAVERLEDPLRGLVELLLLQRELEVARARRLLGASVHEALHEAGILVRHEERVRTDHLSLTSFRSLSFFRELGVRQRVYFGNDSIALGVYQSPIFAGRALDLCSGTSIQAMIAVQRGARAVAVEIQPRAAAVAEVNVRLNGLEGRVRIENRSLQDYASQVDEPFDLITFNPPLVPIPPALYYPIPGNGGSDGLEITRAALDLYLSHLAPGGAIELVGLGLGRDQRPTFVDDLRQILAAHGATARVLIPSRARLRRGDALFDTMAQTAAISSAIPLEVSHAAFELHFETLGVDTIYLFFMRCERGDGDPQILDLADGEPGWFV